MALFHLHKWTDWAVSDRGDVAWRGAVVGWYIVQERHCPGCGKTQVKDKAHFGDAPRSFCHRVSAINRRTLRKDGVTA